MTGEITPKVVNIDELVNNMSRSLVTASEMVRTLTGADSPHIYVIPDMSVTINMSFTYEEGRVKGVLSRTKESQSQQVESSISFRIVTVPRPIDAGSAVTPNLGFLPPAPSTGASPSQP